MTAAIRAIFPLIARDLHAEIERLKANTDFHYRQKRGLRIAVAWLHARAKSMSDPKATEILNSAATNLGWEIDELAGIKRTDVYCRDVLDRAQAENARLRKALEPFVKLATRLLGESHVLGQYIKVRWEQVTWHGEHDILPADLRAAARALAEGEK